MARIEDLARVLWPTIIVPALVAGVALAETRWTHLGEPFQLDAATPISDLAAHPEMYFDRQVRIEGVIASTGPQDGCFIEVVSEDGLGEGVLITFPDLERRFPTACAGRRAIVEGLFYRKIYPASRVSHWQKHSFRKGKPVPDFSIIPGSALGLQASPKRVAPFRHQATSTPRARTRSTSA